jgi:putative protease
MGSWMTRIELLAPAKDFECGKAAIDHGADAIYIGGPAFGARTAAGNSMADIERLVSYAHRYWAKVYLTLNTILFDYELAAAREITRQAWESGVDALIIQDLGLLELDLPPLPLIASTQMHNADPGHVRFLEQSGFQRVILARELTLTQIREIRRSTTIELEAFVHGSLCVSYSGRCYLSAALSKRSANRGACSQPCRLPWTLIDAQGRIIQQNRYLLSLKDMDRSDCLAELIACGISAFKIEGRLKDRAYVKNITAFYRNRIDGILESRTDLQRASSGRTDISFTPAPYKTFCRGSTNYFLHGDADDIWSPDTPKSTGEKIGIVTQTGPDWFTLDTGAGTVNAGDGLCFFDGEKDLKGLQVVKVAAGRIQVHISVSGLRSGMAIFRNRDHRFLKQLDGHSSSRRIALHLTFRDIPEGFLLEGQDEDGVRASVILTADKKPADKPEAAVDTIRKQLSRMNDTIFYLASLDLASPPCFLRTAELNRLRRDLTAAMEDKRLKLFPRLVRPSQVDPQALYPITDLDFSYNVSNLMARKFYHEHGVSSIESAFEQESRGVGTKVMTTRHCLRRCLSACPRRQKKESLAEPLFIQNGRRRFRLAFDCFNCLMFIIID